MSDWDVVQQLAAEFQKIQASSGAQKLSERNCVEVVSKLVEMGLLDILYTLDGKEYVTHQQLEREIRDELMANKGRLNIVDLQQILNVDLSHIEAKVGDILKKDRNIFLLQGELIDKSYMSALCEEVNETLQEVGQMSIADLSRNFGLPNDFLMEHIEASIGTKIRGQLDKTGSGAIYTDAFVARYTSRIRGLFSAMTRPTAIGLIMTQGNFQEKLFTSVLHDLVSKGVLAGALHGHKAVYVPTVYTKNQNRWADSFFEANGYLEYDALQRLGIEQPREFVSHRYSSREDVVELSSCVVGEGVMTELAARLEDTLSTDGWVDVLSLLPAPCTKEDAESLVGKKFSSDPELRAVGACLLSKSFMQSCLQHCQPMAQEKAQKLVSSDAVRASELLQRSQELEDTNTRSTGRKKGGRDKRRGGKRGSQSQETSTLSQFVPPEEVTALLAEKFPDCPENVLTQVGANIMDSLQSVFCEELRSGLATLGQDSSASQHRKRHANIQERVQGLWTNAKLFEKALSHFDADGTAQLSKYLLRTLCSELTNMVLLYMADDGVTQETSAHEMTPKERTKIISTMSEPAKTMCSELDKSLTGKDTDKFFELFESVCAEDFCGILLRKPDKKKERQLLFSHRQSLLESVREEQDPAMSLHLITVTLFQQTTGAILHTPGRLIPLVLSCLTGRLDEKTHGKLTQCQQLLGEQLRAASDVSEGCEAGEPGGGGEKLDTLLLELREQVLAKPKKNTDTAGN